MVVLNEGFVYVVTMYKYGNRNSHSYITCVSENKLIALEAARLEKQFTNNAFVGEVIKVKLNTRDDQFQIILPLKSVDILVC